MNFPHLESAINQINNDYLVIIVYPDDGWILEKIATALAYGLKNSVLFEYQRTDWHEFVEKCSKIHSRLIIYYVNYDLFKKPSGFLDGAWFTHLEEDALRAKRFHQVAQNVEFGCFQNSVLSRVFEGDLNRRAVMTPGVDPDFKPILRVGVVGRNYNYTNRKNVELVFAIANSIGNIEICQSGGGLSRTELLSFYRSLDVTFIASTVEGGPMSFHESLSVGCPVIIGDNVGYAPDYGHLPGVYTFQHDDFSSLVRVFAKLKKRRIKLSEAVADVTWNAFVQAHHINFTKWALEYY